MAEELNKIADDAVEPALRMPTGIQQRRTPFESWAANERLVVAGPIRRPKVSISKAVS